MIKKTAKKIYNTETATVVKKITYGEYGDPAGYEFVLYCTPEGSYFLYTYGGEKSAFAQESITGYSEARAKAWIRNHE